ncbi:GntR family transcriptional regulator [Gordonia sp. NPDC003376]
MTRGTGDAPSVAFDPTVPLHHQVYLQLRREIEDGLWFDRDDFPGEKELARRLGISVITSRSALDRLAGDGWIERRRGKRPLVIHQPVGRPGHTGPSVAVGPEHDYTYEVLRAETTTAPAEACAAFGISPGSVLWQCMRLRRDEGLPHSVTHNAQLPALGSRHSRTDLETKSMITLLGEEGHIVARMRRRFAITHAPTVVTEALGLTIAERVLVSTFVLSDESDEILQWLRIYLHPNRSTPEETMDLTTGTWTATAPM